ncbi:response regulator [Gimesia aquarii]|uniref:CAI-1 autoinducer sensor kinase/phosphatase CqsS n=1 Tax=Gimesia aquarii TaxID=2527964 RepID=A0A517X034_9PLAN|nr:response regulator [Gimesia aquarii]QDU10866.1 CAI-1 autoinducer sensor kinase/phosphatase CqsS [Gimesia aquarii]
MNLAFIEGRIVGNHTILIADDDEDLTELLAKRCQSLGLQVDTASDATTALRKINKIRHDLVILDVDMPDAGGGLIVRQMMNADVQLASIPTIILTGRSDERTIRRCHDSCSYYVAKCPDVWPRIEPLLSEILSCNV